MSLENVREKKVSIILGDGNIYYLEFGFNQIAQMEEDYGSVETALETLQNNLLNAKSNNKLKTLRRFLRYCLQKNHPELDDDLKVGDLMSFALLEDIIVAVMHCVTESLPSISDEEKEKLMKKLEDKQGKN